MWTKSYLHRDIYHGADVTASLEASSMSINRRSMRSMVIIPTGSRCKEAGSVGTDRTIDKAPGSKQTARCRAGSACHHGCACLKGTYVKKHRPAREGDSDNWQPRLPLGQQLGGWEGREGGNWLFTVYDFYRDLQGCKEMSTTQC